MFVVGKIETTHAQWTVGEFAYAYMRALAAIRREDYRIAHASRTAFDLYLPSTSIQLNLSCSTPVPMRVRVDHAMDVSPQDMTKAGFSLVAKMILGDVTRDLAVRCPRRTSCMCRLQADFTACGTTLGRQEFYVEGMIAKAAD